MSIIVSRTGEKAIRVPPTRVAEENFLESYVALNPEILPLQELRRDLTLLLLARQFPTLSGPIDVLAVDDVGILYIIETKLYRNADKRRVVAQVLDYGAAIYREIGSSPEPLSALESKLPDLDLRTRIAEEFGTQEDESSEQADVLSGLRRCLRDGTTRFVVLMDSLDDRLRDLILFLNQSSQFALFAVEAQFYQHGDLEIVVPTLFGGERAQSSVQVRRRGNEYSFFEYLGRHHPQSVVEACRAFYELMCGLGANPNWGSGDVGAFNPRLARIAHRALFTLDCRARLSVNFKWMRDSETAVSFRDALAQALRDLGFVVPPDYASRFPSYQSSVWCPAIGSLKDAIPHTIAVATGGTSGLVTP